jgi:hypothetical protein
MRLGLAAGLLAGALLAAAPAAAGNEKIGLRLSLLNIPRGFSPGIGIEYHQERGRFLANVTRLEWMTSSIPSGALFVGEDLRIFAPIEEYGVEVGGHFSAGPLISPQVGLLIRLAIGAGATVRFLDNFYGGLQWEMDLLLLSFTGALLGGLNTHTFTLQVGMVY